MVKKLDKGSRREERDYVLLVAATPAGPLDLIIGLPWRTERLRLRS
jgi:hypothetical protein